MSGGTPPVLEAILQAADAAGIGLSVSVLEEGSSRCVYASEAAAALLGVTPRDLVGHSVRDFLAPESVAELVGLAQQMRSGERRHGDVVEVSTLHGDASAAALLLAYAPVAIEGETGVLTFLVDVGRQRRERLELAATARRLAQLIAQAPDAIVINTGRMIAEANPAAARMLGVETPEVLVGRSMAEFVVDEELPIMGERMARVARGERLEPWVYRAERPDGSQVSVEIASFLSEYGGEPAVIAFGRDVTERERLQEQLARADRLAALGTLAAGVAHEINNPLAALSLNAEVLQRELEKVTSGAPATGELARAALALGDLFRSVERIKMVVRDLGSFSRTGTESLGPVDVAAVVDAAVRIARHATKQRARVELDLEPLPRVLGKAGKLEQVLVNLIVNAAHALREDLGEAVNRIVVRGRRTPDGRVRLEVEDNGEGMTVEAAGRAFEPFFTTKPLGAGTGLGLFICHNIVTQFGGELSVESDLGRGTTMRVTLLAAAHPGAQAKTVPAPAPRREPAAPARVLVVDDEPSLCRMLVRLLSDRYDITAVSSGEEAAELLTGGHGFDVILCDLMMPNTTGMDLHALLESSRPEMARQMVFMTGGTFTKRASEFLEQVANDCLEKPFKIDVVEAALQRALAAKSR